VPGSRLAVLTATACLGALVVQGCGDSDSEPDSASAPASSATETTPPKSGDAAFVRRLDAICKSGNERVKPFSERSTALQKRVNTTTGAEQDKALGELGATIASANEISGEVIEEMRALDPPPSEQKFFDNLVEIADEQQARFEEFAAALKARDTKKIGPVSQTLAGIAVQRRTLIADHGGFKYCGTA
jgi:hypothetical protein